MSPVEREQHSACRALWLAVLHQALEDIRTEGTTTQDYAQARAFVLGEGAYAASRAAVADYVGCHPDEIGRAGAACIAARRAARGLPPELPPNRAPSPKAPLPRLVAVPAPVTHPALTIARNGWPHRRPGAKAARQSFVFNPFARLPSEASR